MGYISRSHILRKSHILPNTYFEISSTLNIGYFDPGYNSESVLVDTAPFWLCPLRGC